MAHTRPDTPHVGVPIPKDEKKPKRKPDLPPPNTKSVGRSPVTGQPADDG